MGSFPKDEFDCRLLVTDRVRGRSPVWTYCPAHEDHHRPNLAIYPDGTYCFVCGFREDPERFRERVRTGKIAVFSEGPKESTLDRPPRVIRPGSILLWHRALLDGPFQDRKQYFLERGFRLEAIVRYRFGHTGGWFSIPVFQGTRIIGVQFRVDPRWADPEEPRYRSPSGQPVLVLRPNPDGHPTVICEGPLDCYLLSSYGVDAVTTTGGASSLHLLLDLFGRSSVVAVLTDRDEAGDRAADRLLAYRPRWYRVSVPEPFKDIGEAIAAIEPFRRGESIGRWLTK